MVGSVWETKPDMVATGEENTYSYTIKDVDEATGVKYLVVVGEVQSADQMAFENVTKNFKELLPQVAVMGVNNWDGTDKMTVADDYLSASITLSLSVKKYELKLTVDGQWKGHKNENHITRANNSSVFKNDDGNGSITADLAGDYVFTYTYATQTLVVTYPVPTYTVTVTAENGTVTGSGEYEENTEVTLVAAANEGYEFVNWTAGETVVSTENPYKFTVTADVALVANFKLITLHKVLAGEDLQAAVNKANSGDTVLVQAGTYEGNFTMKDGVYVSGGWNADFTAQTEHASILDAKASGRVLNQPANFETLTIWDNFTIQNGKLTEIAADKLGSGVALMKKGRVINCLVQNNTFDYSGNCMGGGIGQETGDKNDTCAINCVVRYNTATHGGGVRIRGVILNSTIEYNESSNNGGGLYLQAGSAYNCIITNNVSLAGGGGVDMYGTGSLVNCLVANNTAGNVGGLSMRSNNRETADSGSDIINCTIVNNTQKNTNNPQFCGVRLDVRSNPNRAFVNNVVYGNTINGEVQAQEWAGLGERLLNVTVFWLEENKSLRSHRAKAHIGIFFY